MPPTTQAADSSNEYLNLRDSFVPLFNGQPSEYREYRKRLLLYQKKMLLSKRGGEAVLNIIGSFQGVVWRLFEDFPVEDCEKEDAFGKILSRLDRNFEYDDRVLLPNDFEAYFNGLQRKPQQTLLAFVTDHDEAYRKLTGHKINLPNQVQGWHLLKRAGLTREQRQMVTLKAPTLEKANVIEALYLLYGQDYKAGGWHTDRNHDRRPQKWKGRGYAAFDDDHDGQWDEAYYEDDWAEADDTYSPDYEDTAFDEDAVYYGYDDEPPEEHEGFDEDASSMAEAYDSAYATYMDARQRFQQLKLARGYLPIVALTDGQNASSSTTSSPTGQGKGRDKGRGKGKGKNKNKSSTVIRYPPSTGGKADPRGRAKSATASMTCLRCGQLGHWAASCPQNAKGSTSPSNKRPAPSTTTTEGMAVHSESALVQFQDIHGVEHPEATMLDPGASAFLSGYGPFKRYVEHLNDLGYPVNTIRFARCERLFQFGGDASSQARWTVNLPVMIDDSFGTIQCYLVPGNTPLLMGRPVIEALHMGIDFSGKQVRFGNSPWQPVLQGRHGEYLLSLTAGMDTVPDPTKTIFELNIAEEVPGSHLYLQDFNQLENIFLANDQVLAANGIAEQPLKKNQLHTIELGLLAASRTAEAFVTQELHRDERQHRVLWEVYCDGESRTAHLAEAMGMQVERFSLSTGWDFNLLEHQRLFLERQQEEMPDEILLAPTCKLWSRMQTLACRTEPQKEALIASRERHHRRHLQFCKRVYLAQIEGARHAHLEQPKSALSWKTSALKALPGYAAEFDQCRYGAQCLDGDGQWKPVQKSTRIQTTKKAVAEAMHLVCQHDHEHCHLEGSAPGYGARTTYMENYQPGMAATLAAAMMQPEAPHHWETAHAVSSAKAAGHLVKLHTEHKADALRTVQRLHRNLGHPSADALADLLAARGAHPNVIEAARKYQCVACAKYKKPNEAAPASMPLTRQFNDTVQADVFYIKLQERKHPVLSIVDVATRYMSAYLLDDETTDSYVKALEKMWLRHFGPPKQLVTDEGRSWLGSSMEAWTASWGVDHQVAPGEAHERLALVERRHAVLRKAVEIYMDDRKLHNKKGIREALTHVVPQQNSTPSVAGFSPSQWVLGYQPELSHLLDANLNPAQLAGSNETFESNLEKRTAAKIALTTADADNKLRRALGRRYQGQNKEHKLGEKVWFWRDARQGMLNKIRWLGPAHVVMREEHIPAGSTKPQVKTYWLSYKTQLIRAAPHHVRGDILGPEHVLDDLQSALNHVRQLKSRGVTRCYDLLKVNRQRLEEVEEEEQHDDPQGSLDEHEPPPQRLRLEPPAAADIQAEEYTPTSPAHSGHAPTSPTGIMAPPLQEHEPPDTGPLASPTLPVPALVPVPDSPASRRSRSAPSSSAQPSPEPTPHGSHPPIALDPATAALYQPVEAESFQERRNRFNRQETLSFGPWRSTPPRTATSAAPYALPECQVAPHSATTPASDTAGHDNPDDAALLSQAFMIDELIAHGLPRGWTFESGYFQLEKHPMDYWEVRAGCLLRHHVTPRRQKMSLDQLPRDAPFAAHQLDQVRVTVVYDAGGRCSQHTDDGTTTTPPCDTSWTGVSIFQIKGDVRKEHAMYVKEPLVGARQMGKMTKQRHVKAFKKDKNNLSERTMNPDERAQFKAAKVKELRSFFENQVWTFETTKEAEPSRTLTSRMLLKWSKNPDGTPRAKARLIVRGFMDPDAWAGTVPTSSPTTTRLSRSVLLSLAANMHWPIWTSDIATAFLQGKPQSRKLWVQLPAECLHLLGATADTRMLLLKPCYGQIDAPRAWYMAAVDKLLSMGLRQHPQDPCCFLAYEMDFNPEHNAEQEQSHRFGPCGLCGIIIMHVDDMLGCGSESSACYQDLIVKLKATFNFREWKTGVDGSDLTYCGCDLKITPEGGYKLEQSTYMKKVKPIAIDKRHNVNDSITESEVSQLRALLGSLQWPAVQSSPHLQGSTSILSGYVSRVTVQTLMDCNKLLKFSKENADVGLIYNHIGHVQDLRLVCFFDAAFATRSDGSSQVGYLILLVHKTLLQPDGPEGAYHILGWRSQKTPRVARSSLGAEAQGGGQASDALEHVCIYWSCLLDPRKKLKDHLDVRSPLEPTMITDAKALYDSYHREGFGTSVIDKRVSLEVRVVKERLQALGGQLRWMSSERQMADGLTKESARNLLAQRLRYGQLKLVWDPDYKAAKKKTKAELKTSLQESTFQPDSEEANLHQAPPPADSQDAELYEHPIDEVTENEEALEEAHMAVTDVTVSYLMEQYEYALVSEEHYADVNVFCPAASHGVSTIVNVNESRLKNLICWALILLLLPGAAATSSEESPEDEHFTTMVITCLCIMVGAFFLLGRWSHPTALTRRQALFNDNSCQTDDTTVSGRLRAEIEDLKLRLLEANGSAMESQKALKLAVANMEYVGELLYRASSILRRCLKEMDEHRLECPLHRGAYIARHGRKLHVTPHCSSLEGRDERNVEVFDPCALCSTRILPPDSIQLSGGSSLRTVIATWLEANGSHEDVSAPSP